MNINLIIADNLRCLRLERNLSLGQLSELSGVSKVMLSQIEKGDANPTINTIWKIAKGLNVPYTVLIDKQHHETTVIHKNNIEKQVDENGGYRIYCYYSNVGNRNFELFLMELDPGASHISVGHSDKSEEYITILEGSLLLETKEEQYTLYPEDAISFDASAIHNYKNPGQVLLKAIVLNFYPI